MKVPLHKGRDPVGLKIKKRGDSPRKEIARLTGRTIAETIDRAVVETLDRPKRRRNPARLRKRLLQIGRECASLPLLDKRRVERMFYDMRGLPK